MKLLYSDRAVAVAWKEAGEHSQPAPESRGNDLVTLLRAELGGEILPVHRLDLGTRGVTVYARTPKAAASLSRSIAEGLLDKTYLALVHGSPGERGEMTDLLYHQASVNKSFVTDSLRRGVKEARLTYETVARLSSPLLGECSLVRVQLQTGRTHQIRVQFSHRGFPLVGDSKYGARDPVKFPALAAVSLSFPHPSDGRTVTFEQKIGLSELSNNILTDS